MNIATALKSEITRVSRKVVRTELQFLKKTTTNLRLDNADLKRRLVELEKLVKQLSKGGPKKLAAIGSQDKSGTVARFSGKGLAAQRKRLGLSAAEMGVLLGCSGQSVYKWEQGTTRPRASQMPAIVVLRNMGKKEAAAKLALPQK